MASRRILIWLTGWVGATAFYVLLVDTTDIPEMVVAAAAAVIAATGFELGREQHVVTETIRVRWLRRVVRALVKVPSDVVAVSATALRQLVAPRQTRGRFHAVPFRCDETESLRIGRWALAESAGSFAPNTIVIGVDQEAELLLGHELVASDDNDAIDVLGLG